MVFDVLAYRCDPFGISSESKRRVCCIHDTVLATYPPWSLEALKPRITLALHLTCCSTPTLDTPGGGTLGVAN